jgi:hypothetical protein
MLGAVLSLEPALNIHQVQADLLGSPDPGALGCIGFGG